jgi:alpha-methylacyl-CoA racemase
MTGPLRGVRVVELAGLGPGPFCGMLLADMGATVLRVDRPDGPAAGNPLRPQLDLLNRGKQSVAVDLKTPEGVELVLRLAQRADVIFEGWRPGVAERLGIGPDQCCARNPRLVYGRMTGFGQTGELAARAGHDINYIALSGVLDAIGPRDGGPVPPLNVVGDFGGGALYLAFGLLCAVLEAVRSGRGQVVDAAIVDGTSHLMTMFYALRAQGMWAPQRGANLLDGGAHFYGVYACADGRFISVGAIEPQFYRQLLERLGLGEDPEFIEGHSDPGCWPALRVRLAAVFATRGRDEWVALFACTDACVAPVLTLDEVAVHPHNAGRAAVVVRDGVPQPAPAPRFSRTVPEFSAPPPVPGRDSRPALLEWGLAPEDVDALLRSGAITSA